MNKGIISASDIDNMPQRYRAEFINSLSGFKSANLVGTRGQLSGDNLAIVSSVVHIGAHPPLLGMVMRPHTVQRDTLENIKQTGVYTLNNVTQDMVRSAHQTSARYNSDISEFEQVGLTPLDSNVIAAPYVAESTIQLSLQVQDIVFLAINKTELVIGQIVEAILPEGLIDKTGYLDIEACGSMAISGLVSYHQTKRVDRFGYAKADKPLESAREKGE